MTDSSRTEKLAAARALLQKGQKVFIKNDHPPGFLHGEATWQGEYHLAHVQESYDGATNRFKVLWKRNGRAATATHALRSPTQILLKTDDELDLMSVQIEDDANGNVHYGAKLVDLCNTQPGEVWIKWDRGDEEIVNVSQVSLGFRSRSRRQRDRGAGKPDDENCKRRPKKKNAKKGNGMSKSGKKNREEGVEIISIESSSEEEGQTNQSSTATCEGGQSVSSAAKPAASEHDGTPAATSGDQREGGSEREDEWVEDTNLAAAQNNRKRPWTAGSEGGRRSESQVSPAVKPAASQHVTTSEAPGGQEEYEGDQDGGLDQEANIAAAQDNRKLNLTRSSEGGQNREDQISSAAKPPASKNNGTTEASEDPQEEEGELEAGATLEAAQHPRKRTWTTTTSEGGQTNESQVLAAAKAPLSQHDATAEESGDLQEDEGEQEDKLEEGSTLAAAQDNRKRPWTKTSEGCKKGESQVSSAAKPAASQNDAIPEASGYQVEDEIEQEDEMEEEANVAADLDNKERPLTASSGGDKKNEGHVSSAAKPAASQNDTTPEASGDQGEDESEQEDEMEEDANFAGSQNNGLSAYGILGSYLESCTNESMSTGDQEATPDEETGGSLEAAADQSTRAQGSPAGSVCSLRTQESSTSSLRSVTQDNSSGSEYSDESEEGSSLCCSHFCSDESALEAPTMISVKRKRVPTSSLSPDDESEVAALKKRVTPQKSATASSVSSKETHQAAHSTKRDRILLNGFCRTIPSMKDDPCQTIELIQSILDKAKACKKDPDEFREALVDANMLLQETIFNLNEHTKFIETPASDAMKHSTNSSQNEGNKSHIIRLAKRFKLSSELTDDLFRRLDVNLGYYSIDDAIPVILELKNSTINASKESDEDENDNVAGAAAKGEQQKRSEILGSRVRTVFEDGAEYEGTVSTVHYRVTYDDGETETFLNEAEAFENLACNDKFMNDPSGDEIRCSALEIFSGCSLLSTCCKRKGMHVTSIDNDLDSNADVKADFYCDYVQSLLSSQSFDYIHASPVCSTYSVLAAGKHRNKQDYNRSLQSYEADAMLTTLYFFVANALKNNSNATVTIENPRGWMQKGNIMKELFEGELGFKRFGIHYCQFGRGEKKPTNIWTNDMKLGNILESIGEKCNCPIPHEESVKMPGPKKNFAALPLKLCQLLSTYVQSKHTQQKFDKLLASRGESGTMAH